MGVEQQLFPSKLNFGVLTMCSNFSGMDLNEWQIFQDAHRSIGQCNSTQIKTKFYSWIIV